MFCSRGREKKSIKPISEITLDIWRKGYHGGHTEVYKQGLFDTGYYYKIDCNSAYALAMRSSYPMPHAYYIAKRLTDRERYGRFWIGIKLDGDMISEVFNSIEDRDFTDNSDYYYRRQIGSWNQVKACANWHQNYKDFAHDDV